MNEKSKKFPSQIKYESQNPIVTFRVPIALKNRIEDVCKATNLTKSQIIKNFFIDMTTAFDDLKKKHEAELEKFNNELNACRDYAEKHERELETQRMLKLERDVEIEIKRKFEESQKIISDKAHSEGFSEGSKLSVLCKYCDQPMRFDLSKQPDVKNLVLTYLREAYYHTECVEK
jgi:antitoxin component of RelBE/YafQ-DinJ toxin-antitoxin module